MYLDDSTYDLSYEESGDENDVDDGLQEENNYYTAKTLKDDKKYTEAIDLFNKIIKDGTINDWAFKSLKQLLKIYHKTYQNELFLQTLKHVVLFKDKTDRQKFEKTFNKNIDLLNELFSDKDCFIKFLNELKEKFSLREDESTIFKINIQLAKIYLINRDVIKFNELINSLTTAIDTSKTYSDFRKSMQFLEIYQLQMEYYSSKSDWLEIQILLNKCNKLSNTITHPLSNAIIKDYKGKILMMQHNYEKAYSESFEAFKFYDECGNEKRFEVINRIILLKMVSNTNINPFDSPEMKSYKLHDRIKFFSEFYFSFMENNVEKFIDLKNLIAASNPTYHILIDVIEYSMFVRILKEELKVSYEVNLNDLSKRFDVDDDKILKWTARSITNKHIKGIINQPNNSIRLCDPRPDIYTYGLVNEIIQLIQSYLVNCFEKMEKISLKITK